MEILPGVHRIANAISTAYLLVDEQAGLTVVDCGPAGFDRTILAYLRRIGRQPDEVQRIILTHRHFDHMGGAAQLRTATRARVWAHPLDAPQISGAEPYRHPAGIAGKVMQLATPLISPFHACPVDDSLVPGESLDLGGMGELQVRLTPGHTPGHCSLILPARRLAILGDALQHFFKIPNVSFKLVNDDDAMAHDTVRQLGELEVDAAVFGHGSPILKEARAALRAAATSQP